MFPGTFSYKYINYWVCVPSSPPTLYFFSPVTSTYSPKQFLSCEAFNCKRSHYFLSNRSPIQEVLACAQFWKCVPIFPPNSQRVSSLPWKLLFHQELVSYGRRGSSLVPSFCPWTSVCPLIMCLASLSKLRWPILHLHTWPVLFHRSMHVFVPAPHCFSYHGSIV